MELNIAALNLPKNTISQLRQFGYNYSKDIEPNKLKEKIDLNLDISLNKAPETKTAFDLYNEELVNSFLLTYNENLDLILRDTILPKTITELSGESGSGKTQICFQLSIAVQIPKWCGGLEGEAIYIDTNSNFASHRIREIGDEFIKRYNSIKPSVEVPSGKFNEDSILQHIYHTKICNILEFTACIKSLASYISGKQIRLVIIDSISFILRTVDVQDRRTLITKVFRDLRVIAQRHNFAVVITNDVTTRVNKGESYLTPSFGDSFYHLVNTRILLSRTGNIFHGKLEKNIIHSKKETTFYL